MQACRHCGSADHADSACPLVQSAELEALGSTALAAARSNPASKPLRDCKAQLGLAMRQREEDPARVWLELVSIRESARKLPPLAHDDPILASDIDKFRAKLEAEIFKLTQEVGDEVLAPLYVWVDLIRRRNTLDREIIAARNNVKQARAARGDKTRAPRTELESKEHLEKNANELEAWRAALPAAPAPREVAVWEALGYAANRTALAQKGRVIQEQGAAARAALASVPEGRALGMHPYIGSRAELIVGPTIGGAMLLAWLFAGYTLAKDGGAGAIALTLFAALLTFALAGAVAGSVVLRQRARREVEHAISSVWYFTFFQEKIEALDIEVGWLRALYASFAARRVFDESRAEGLQIEDLKKWRPDLRDFVVEVAKQGEETETALAMAGGNSLQPPAGESQHVKLA
jgi:hypothetical protein